MKSKFLIYVYLIITLLVGSVSYAQTVIAIDAGHGGKDPGALGKSLGIKEKDITLAIAKDLKKLLDSDPNFKAVMTRKGDYFIPVPKRSEIARKNQANYLVSIHADSSPNSKNLKGVSVWVLSNQRASDELGKWLEDHEKQSELLGETGSILAGTNERYFSQTVLDLQFSYVQRSGYEMGRIILQKLNNVATLAKNSPQHASLSVLRSPDIPSILIETGFLSNEIEEQKLANPNYRKKLAKAIYQGLVEYHKLYAVKQSRINNKATKVEQKDIKTKLRYHRVEKGETLYSISRLYNMKPEKLVNLNNIKNNRILVGQKLKLE